MTDIVQPLPPSPLDTSEVVERFYGEGADQLDGICIAVEVTNVIERALCDHYGEDYYDEPVTDGGQPYEPFTHEVERIFAYLVEADIIRREDFVYDEDTHEVRRADHP